MNGQNLVKAVGIPEGFMARNCAVIVIIIVVTSLSYSAAQCRSLLPVQSVQAICRMRHLHSQRAHPSHSAAFPCLPRENAEEPIGPRRAYNVNVFTPHFPLLKIPRETHHMLHQTSQRGGQGATRSSIRRRGNSSGSRRNLGGEKGG